MSRNDLVQAAPVACQCHQQATQQSAAGADPVLDTVSVAVRSIDVSHLPPPLPMVRILETLRLLDPGQTLLVQHTRRPIHLYPKLDALGCTHETVEHQDGKIEVRITKPAASPA